MLKGGKVSTRTLFARKAQGSPTPPASPSVSGDVPVRLVVGLPAGGGSVNLNFMNCLLYMSMYIMRVQLPMPLRRGNLFEIITKRGSMLPVIRQELVEDALKLDADYLLLLDTDQLFPANTAHRLMAHAKDVVACNVATKLLPPDTGPTARLKGDGDHGIALYSTPESPALEQVWRIGCGVMMLKPRLFRDIPKPWFMFRWDEQYNRFHGEDWYLCERLEERGVDIWVDHKLSLQVEHEGFASFTHEMANMSKAVRDENPEAFDVEGRHSKSGVIQVGGPDGLQRETNPSH